MPKAVETALYSPPRDLTSGQWPVLRACLSLGHATTAEVVRKIQEHKPTDYRSVLVRLRSLSVKGYLTLEHEEGSRREVWTPNLSAEAVVME